MAERAPQDVAGVVEFWGFGRNVHGRCYGDPLAARQGRIEVTLVSIDLAN
jgi:hypothetical protein